MTGTMPAKYEVNYSRFNDIEDPEPQKFKDVDYLEPDDAINKAYEAEMVKDQPVDKLREMKIKLAMDAYEKRRPKDKVMHHYVIKDAGDVDAIGEYYPTGDERNSCPIYKNARGITLTREKQPVGKDSDEEQYGWILGSIDERRPLYGCMSDDLSVPTLGWQGFTAPEPVPTIRYYSHASASRMFKDKGNAAVQAKEYVEAESWYTKALSTKMDPSEFPEPMGMIYSNRAQVRLHLLKYDQAADDADMALRFLNNVIQMDEPTILLKQKTAVRRAKALAGMKQFHEAETVMKNARMKFPDSEYIESCWKEMEVAKKSDAREAQTGPTSALLRFVGKAVEEVQQLVRHHSNNLADAVFPTNLAKLLLKLEYLFSKADGEALQDIQTLFRANGGLRTLLHIVQVQWKNNMEGKFIDMDKLDSLSTVLSIIALACDGQSESVAMVSSETPAMFAALGGCNRKVDAGFCTSLLKLVSQVWDQCNLASKEAAQSSSVVIERAASFLSKLVLREQSNGPVEVSSSDAPLVSQADKDRAFDLLSGLASQENPRIEKRAVRGAAPMLASFDGTGFLTSDEKKYRDLGNIFLEKVVKEPSILAPIDVTNLLTGVQLLIMYGPASGSGVQSIALEGMGSIGSTARFVDLESWANTEDGAHASRMLEAVARVLDYRLVKHSHELGKGEYESAFTAGHGWTVCIPLVQAPEAFAKAAIACMASMPSMPACAAAAVGALLGFPAPENSPSVSYVKQCLSSSSAVRACVAKLLSKSVTTEGFLCYLNKEGAKCMGELMKLIALVSLDGKSSLEALHDMLYVFYQISQNFADPLCKNANEDFMSMLVGLSKSPVEDAPVFYAKGILAVLKLNHSCNKVIKTLLSRFDAGVGADAEDALRAI